MQPRLDPTRRQLQKAATRQRPRKRDRAEADPYQPADLQADRFEHAPNLAIATLLDHRAVPVVDTLATGVLQPGEARRPVLQFHAFEQPLALFVREQPNNSHRVFALDLETRMRHPVGQIPRRGHHQQPFGVQIQTAHRDPAPARHLRETLENGRPGLRVVMRDNLASGLVINQNPRRLARLTPLQGLAVDANLVGWQHALADMRGLSIDRHAPGHDQLLHFAARADSGVRQHLVEFVGLRVQGRLGGAPSALEQLARQRLLRHRRHVDVLAVGQR